MNAPLDMDTVGNIYVHQAGFFEELGQVLIRIADEWKLVWSEATPLAVTVTPSFTPYGAGASSGTIAVTTSTVTAVPSGGTPPYTYAWNRDDAGSPSWSIGSATAATTSFTCSAVADSGFETAEFECVITDNLGATVTTALVNASVENYGGFS
jgi:hypothetical protein